MLNKKSIVSHLKKDYKNISNDDLEKVVDSFYESIGYFLANDYDIEIRGFGKFMVKTTKARQSYDIYTKEFRDYEAVKGIVFRSSAILNNESRV